jgi:hypothetical protein
MINSNDSCQVLVFTIDFGRYFTLFAERRPRARTHVQGIDDWRHDCSGFFG